MDANSISNVDYSTALVNQPIAASALPCISVARPSHCPESSFPGLLAYLEKKERARGIIS